MKNLLYFMLAAGLFICISCEQKATPSEDQPDYEMFDKQVADIRTFIAAYSAEDSAKMADLIADTMVWRTAVFNNNKEQGKAEYLAALSQYHREFDNISFEEGIVADGVTEPGFWSGSVFPKEKATDTSVMIRIYGTWSATHTETAKDVGAKYFALASVNEEGKITYWDEYFDVHGLAAQLAVSEEE